MALWGEKQGLLYDCMHIRAGGHARHWRIRTDASDRHLKHKLHTFNYRICLAGLIISLLGGLQTLEETYSAAVVAEPEGEDPSAVFWGLFRLSVM